MSENATTPTPQLDVIKVTPRQVKAAQIAIKARKKLGEDIPPGLQNIANAKRQP